MIRQRAITQVQAGTVRIGEGGDERAEGLEGLTGDLKRRRVYHRGRRIGRIATSAGPEARRRRDQRPSLYGGRTRPLYWIEKMITFALNWMIFMQIV